MSIGSQKLKRMPQKNVQEAKRILSSLEVQLKELRQEKEKLRIESLRKIIQKNN